MSSERNKLQCNCLNTSYQILAHHISALSREFQARASNTLAIRYTRHRDPPRRCARHARQESHLSRSMRRVLPPPGLRLSCSPNTKGETYHNSVMNSYERFSFAYAHSQTSPRDASSAERGPARASFILRSNGPTASLAKTRRVAVTGGPHGRRRLSRPPQNPVGFHRRRCLMASPPPPTTAAQPVAVPPGPPLPTTAARPVSALAAPPAWTTDGKGSRITASTAATEPKRTPPLNALQTTSRGCQQAPSGPCDLGGWTVLLIHATPFAVCFITTLRTLTRPQISVDTKADCIL